MIQLDVLGEDHLVHIIQSTIRHCRVITNSPIAILCNLYIVDSSDIYKYRHSSSKDTQKKHTDNHLPDNDNSCRFEF